MRINRDIGRGKEPPLLRIAAVGCWLLVWEISARALNQEILLASPGRVLQILWGLMSEPGFYTALLTSAARIAAGFFIALALGSLLAALAHVSIAVRALMRPFIGCIKSVPVASFVILALIWFKAQYLSVFTAFLMALPIFYSQVELGLNGVDFKLLEMADVFNVSPWRRLTQLYLPYTKAPLLSACRLASGLCWKAGIAAEVIGLPPGSIGERLYDAKLYLNTGEVLAWTLVIVLISIACEKLIPGGDRR